LLVLMCRIAIRRFLYNYVRCHNEFVKKNVKSFPSLTAHKAVLISVS